MDRRKLKDWQFRDYTIKIDRVREVYSLGAGTTEYVDKMFLVDIGTTGGHHTGFRVLIPKGKIGAGIKKLAKEIKEHL